MPTVHQIAQLSHGVALSNIIKYVLNCEKLQLFLTSENIYLDALFLHTSLTKLSRNSYYVKICPTTNLSRDAIVDALHVRLQQSNTT